MTTTLEPQITRNSLLYMQVCVPADWTDEQAEAFANRENHPGTTNGWKIRKDLDLLDGAPERNPCNQRTGCVHIMLDC
jgi:hypothetical protein